MSIQSEITRIESAKTAIATAIEGKGVTVPNGTLLDGMAALVESIEAGGGGGTGNIATGSFTSKTNYNSVAISIMTIDEWVTNYGAFPTTLYAAYFDENPETITSGYHLLYCASCILDGNAQICYATVYSRNNISYVKNTGAIAQANKNTQTIQLISPSQTYLFTYERTYRWVIVW